MDKNKGRLIPNLHTLQYFSDETVRSPFEGELCVDKDTTDIYFWSKNENNVWTKNSRTADIQRILDGYGSLGDNTFNNARAFYESGVIHRFFFSQVGQKVWLDNSTDISKFSYYAIKSIALDKGIQRYVTGLVDSDGSDYTKALIPTSNTYGKLTKEIKLNTWYIVEFYDINKTLLHSVNYLSYQSNNMPIDLNTEEGKVSNTITDASVSFSRSYKNGIGYYFIGDNISDLDIYLTITTADGHQLMVPQYDNKINISGLEKIDTSTKGSYKIKIDYDLFDSDNSSTTVYKIFTDTVVYLASESQKKGIEFSVSKSNSDWHDREYKTIKIRGSGDDNYIVVSDYSVDTASSDTYDIIKIPSKYFKIEKNTISISYTEKTDIKTVDSKSLRLTAYGSVDVIEKPTLDYLKFIPVGYVDDNNGYYEVKYKFFVLKTDNTIYQIPDQDITIYYPTDYTSGRINRLTVSFYNHTETFFSYFRDINLTGAVRRVLTSVNQSDLSGTPDSDRRPILIYSTSDSRFTIGEGTFDKSFVSSFNSIISKISSEKIDYIKIKYVKDSAKYITDYVNTDTFTYTPSFREYNFLNVREDTILRTITNNIKDIPNYGKTYRLIKYKNFTVTNRSSNNKTLGEILQTMDKPTSDFGPFVGYSINNSDTLTDKEMSIVIEPNKSLHIFAFFAKSDTTDNTVVSANFGGSLEITYTLKKANIRVNDPLLVEGYSINSNGKYRCLGALVCHASNNI